MKPDEEARSFAAAARTSAPVADRSTCTQVVIRLGMLSPRGLIAATPKSTITPILFLLAMGLIDLHKFAKLGANLGGAALISSLLKVCIQPSTEPSLTLVVGPVIAIVHSLAPGVAWK